MGKKVKKAAIIAGGTVGGVIGGIVAIGGRIAKKKTIEDLGDNIIDSTLLTGEIAGQIMSGAGDAISGKIRNDADKKAEGKQDMKEGGKKIAENAVENIKNIAHGVKDIAGGAIKGDKAQVKESVTLLAKTAAIGALTVGAVKIQPEETEETEDEE